MIFCLEGINGAGKSTLASRVADEWARRTGGSVTVVDPVQCTEFGRIVRCAVMEGTDIDPVAEAFAFASARLDGLADVRRADRGPTDLVVVERWSGGCRGVRARRRRGRLRVRPARGVAVAPQ